MATADYYYSDTQCLVYFFCNSGQKNYWHWWLGIEPTTLDLSFQSGANDLSITVNPFLSFKVRLANFFTKGIYWGWRLLLLKQPWVKGCPKVSRFELTDLWFTAWCYDHSAMATPIPWNTYNIVDQGQDCNCKTAYIFVDLTFVCLFAHNWMQKCDSS